MFYNVLNNAVKNTDLGGKVTVGSFTEHRRFNVTIADTGKGMTKEQMSTLFSRFKSKESLNHENGTGIGLAIAKSIAEFHNIEVSVTTEIEKKGESFFFIFPEIS